MSKTSKRPSRPSIPYGPEVAREICAGLAEGQSRISICRRMGVASASLYRWRDHNPEFAEAYDAALAAGGGVKRGGRPTDYGEAVARAFCDRIGEGQAMHLVCRQRGMPAQGTLHLWLRERPEFAAMVAVARDLQAQRLFDEVREIADAATPATLQVARIRIAARQWQVAKMAPRKPTAAAVDPEAPVGNFNVRVIRFGDDDDDDGGGDFTANAAAQ